VLAKWFIFNELDASASLDFPRFLLFCNLPLMVGLDNLGDGHEGEISENEHIFSVGAVGLRRVHGPCAED
jgi:hypothetical protein